MQSKQELADACYDEVGRSVAGLVVDCGLPTSSAWKMLQGVKIYERWMLDFWVDRYKQEFTNQDQAANQRFLKKQKKWKAFKKTEFFKNLEDTQN